MSKVSLSPRVAPPSVRSDAPSPTRVSYPVADTRVGLVSHHSPSSAQDTSIQVPSGSTQHAPAIANNSTSDADTVSKTTIGQHVHSSGTMASAHNGRDVDTLYQSLGSFSQPTASAPKKPDTYDDKAAATILEQWQLSPPASQPDVAEPRSPTGASAQNAATKSRPMSSRARAGAKAVLIQAEGMEKMGLSKRSLTAVPGGTKWGPGLLRGVSRLVVNKPGRSQSDEGQALEGDRVSRGPSIRAPRQPSVASRTSDNDHEGLEDDYPQASTSGTVRVDDLQFRSRRASERTSDRVSERETTESTGEHTAGGDEILTAMQRVRYNIRRSTDSVMSDESEDPNNSQAKGRTTLEEESAKLGFVSRVKSLFASRSRKGTSMIAHSNTGRSMADDAAAAVASADTASQRNQSHSSAGGKSVVGKSSSNGSTNRFSLAAAQALGVDGNGDLFAVVKALQVVNHQASHWKKAMRYQSLTVRPLATLAAFIPKLLIEDIKHNDAKYGAFDNYRTIDELVAATTSIPPSMTYFNGAVMIADVTGFTALTEILSKRGNSGVELLTTCMNSFFTKVISLIFAFDGDVVKFAGDSMIVAFYPMEKEKLDADGGLHACCLRALQCAHKLAHKLGKMRMLSDGEVEPMVEHEDEEELEAPQHALSTTSEAPALDARPTSPIRSTSDNLIDRTPSATRRQRSMSTPMPDSILTSSQSDELPTRLGSGSFTRRHGNGNGLLERLGKRMAFKTIARASQAANAIESSGSPNATMERNVVTPPPRRNTATPDPEAKEGGAWARQRMSLQVGRSMDHEGARAETPAKASDEHSGARMLTKHRGSMARTAHDDLKMAQRVPSLASIFSRPPPLKGTLGSLRDREGSASGTSLKQMVGPNVLDLSSDLPPSNLVGSGGSPRINGTKLNHMLSKTNEEWMDRVQSGGNAAGPSRHAPLGRPVSESLSPRATSPEVPHRQRSTDPSPGRGFNSRAYNPVWNRVLGGVGMWIVRGRTADGRQSPMSMSPGVLSKEASVTGQNASQALMTQTQRSVGANPAPLGGGHKLVSKPSTGLGDDLSQFTLSLKIMMGAGQVCVCHVGGGFDEDAGVSEEARGNMVPRWEFFIADRPHAPELDEEGNRQPIAQIADIDKHANAGDVILSREFLKLVPRDCEVEVLDADGARLQNVITVASKHEHRLKMPPTSGRSAKLLPGTKIREPDMTAEPEEFNMLSHEIKSRLASSMRMHILGSVRKHIEAGQLDFVNEIRHLTVLFMGFPGLKQPADADEAKQVANLQWYMTHVQSTIRKHDGSLLQFRCDEKGFLAIAAFGLPGHTHEDNPSRGVLAALEIVTQIKEVMQHRACVGVTTGDLLCACVGARKMRSEYTVFGDAINLSARLMCKSKGNADWGEVLCDEITKSSARRTALFKAMEPLTVKGKKAPLQVYSATFDESQMPSKGQGRGRRPSVDISAFLETKMVGRDAEVGVVMQQVEDLVQNHNGGATIVSAEPGMGKSKLMAELKRKLEQQCMGSEGQDDGSMRARYSVFFAIGDAANKSHRLHPWRRIFRDLFAQDVNNGVPVLGPHRKERRNTAEETGSVDEAAQVVTLLGRRLAKRVASYNTEWRRHLAQMLDLPESAVPLGIRASTELEALLEPLGPDESSMGLGHGRHGSTLFAHPSSHGLIARHNSSHAIGGPYPGQMRHSNEEGEVPDAAAMRIPGMAEAVSSNGTMLGESAFTHVSKLSHAPSGINGPSKLLRDTPSEQPLISAGESVRGGMHAAHPAIYGGDSVRSAMHGGAGDRGQGNGPSIPAAIPEEPPKDDRHLAGKSRITLDRDAAVMDSKAKSSSISFLVFVLKEFISLYGPVVIMLEDIHHYDTWSWQLLIKVVDELSSGVLLLASLRPKDGSLAENTRFLMGKAAVYQQVTTMYKHVADLPTTKSIDLRPFNAEQTRLLMQEVGKGASFSDDWVLAVREKTGGMPMYIEKVAEFLCAKPWMTNEEFGFSGNINGLIGNLSFQQVIMERVDRLRPAVHLTLKVASIMGQWVDLDILHSFYPLDKHKNELKSHLLELEQGNFLKATDTTDVWEFNTVERDIVYEVIPHYQRRRLHAKLALELESRSGELASLTTIAYHWNQSCMGCEVAEMPSAMKAIEFWEKAADACSADSWVEALRLYNKAADIADILSEYFYQQSDEAKIKEQFQSSDKKDIDWALISSFRRAAWEMAMSQLCLAIIRSARNDDSHVRSGESHNDYDHVTLLTEHAHKGLWLLGAPHPSEVTSGGNPSSSNSTWLLACFHCGGDRPLRTNFGATLDLEEVDMIRELLVVLLRGMDYWPRDSGDDDWVPKMWKYILKVCSYYRQFVVGDPFADIVGEAMMRLRSSNTSMLNSMLSRLMPARAGGNKVLPVPSMELTGGRPASVLSGRQTESFSKEDNPALNRTMSI